MKFLVDMNLSPAWVEILEGQGWTAVHWSAVGDPRAPDEALFAWASASGHVIFTHDLDFGSMLALTQERGPSVIQVRARDVMPEHLAATVIAAIRQFAGELEAGALVVVDEARCRVRVLPLAR
jgi:predicted nuclease of predicted toxin-antitoxin system